jgi:hypothetical protein
VWALLHRAEGGRGSWRKLHIAVDADTGQIAAAALTTSDVDDASQVGALLDEVEGPVASLTADGAYDQDGVYSDVVSRHPRPPSSSHRAPMPCGATQRGRRQPREIGIWRSLPGVGRMAWQKSSGYNWRALVEADISRLKRIIGDGLRSRSDRRRATEVAIAVNALNRMLELGRPEYIRFA